MTLSIIIPVLNESSIINRTIGHLVGLDPHGTVEIVVVDGSPTGDTIHSITWETVKKVLSRKGRGVQMNRGAEVARGDVLLFLHADTCLPPGAPDMIHTQLQSKDRVGGAFDLGIDSNKIGYRLIEWMVYLRSRMTRIPYGDQAIFIRRDYFVKLGGFNEIPLMEEVELMQRVKKERGKIVIIPAKVKTSARRWEKEGIVRCTLRNWCLILFYWFGVPPEKLSKYYR